jgi:uncharacterized SAM-binding protein YcdF (DUF218 family)
MPAMIADWLTSSGLGSLKPALAALVLPPVPFIALAFAGAWAARARPRTGRWLVLVACLGIWLGSCAGAARWVEASWLDEPVPLDPAQRAQLKNRAAAGEPLAIVVLGGGMDGIALEYGSATLANASFARLHYGLWLGRQTGIPVGASGGRGWAAPDPAIPAEATKMAEIAQADFGAPLRWVETASRDTHENAVNTLALLQSEGVHEVLLVTHGAHMPRALREFRAAAAALPASAPLQITPAAMGEAYPADSVVLQWLPSGEGAVRMRAALHEVLGSIGARR